MHQDFGYTPDLLMRIIFAFVVFAGLDRQMVGVTITVNRINSVLLEQLDTCKTCIWRDLKKNEQKMRLKPVRFRI